MDSWNSVRLLGSAFRPRTIHLHGVATAAAMLTCAAIVFNVCPFDGAGKRPGGDVVPRGETAPALGIPNESRIAAGANVDVTSRTDSVSAAHSDVPPASSARADLDSAAQTDAPPAAAQPSRPEPEFGERMAALVGPSPFTLNIAATPADWVPVLAKDDSDVEAKPASHEPVEPPPTTDHASEPARDPIVGVWAPGSCAARDFRDGLLPTIINTEGAWAGETFCLFSRRKQTDDGWSVVAKCQNAAERWTSNVRLTVSENRLRWTSRRGTQTYMRCAPDILMAEASGRP